MPVSINFNICDNSCECSGIAVCPTKALYWDETKENLLGGRGMLCVDNNKCISCGKCVGDEGCPIGAIYYAKTFGELEKLTSEYEVDIKQVEHLFVERYGAAPIDESLCVEDAELHNIISENKGVLLIEEFTDESIQCLLSSIPVETIIHEIQMVTDTSDIRFYRVDVSDSMSEKDTLPRLRIYKMGDFIGQIEGYYSTDQLEEFKALIRKIFM